MSREGPAWYEACRRFVGALVRLYYPDLAVTGAERIPDGPLIVAANHPNSLVDPVLVSTSLPFRIYWIAKATLFDMPALGVAFRALGIIPVHRRHEGGTRDTTSALISAAAEAVASGAVLGIFPEGLSHPHPRLAPLKTGVGRIALAALERLPQGSVVHVQPVVLHFADPGRFGSDAVLAVAEPIAVRAGDTADGVTDLVRVRLEELLVRVDDADQEELLRGVRALERRRLAHEAGVEEPDEHHRLDVDIARAIRRFSAEEPDRILRFRLRLRGYLRRLDRLGLGAHAFDEGPELDASRRVRFALALLPVAALGVAQSWIPWRIAIVLGRRHARRHDATVLSTMHLGAGVPCFAIAWALESLAVAALAGPWWAAAWLLSAPWAGLAARFSSQVLWRGFGRLRDRLLVGREHDVLDALRAERAWLRSEVDRWRDLWTAGAR